MAVRKSDCTITKEEEGTPGGVTYHVILPNKDKSKPVCFRPLKKYRTERCTKDAGYDTWHLGQGACKFHGGASSKNPTIVTGRDARITKMRLHNQIQEYLSKDRSQLLNLDYELAATKAMFEEFLDYFPDPMDDNYSVGLNRFTSLVNTMGSLVDRISKMEARHTLTSAQVLYLRATVADLLMKYIPDPDSRERAARELASRIGGDDIEVSMRPSEIRRTIDA